MSPADELHTAAAHIRAKAAGYNQNESAPWRLVADQLDEIAAFWVDQPEQRWPTFDGLPAVLARAINATPSTPSTSEAPE